MGNHNAKCSKPTKNVIHTSQPSYCVIKLANGTKMKDVFFVIMWAVVINMFQSAPEKCFFFFWTPTAYFIQEYQFSMSYWAIWVQISRVSKIKVMLNKLLYSAKQFASLLVQVFCMCFFKYGTVLLKMPSKKKPKMIIINVHHIF